MASVEIPSSAWRSEDGGRTRLATLVINGVEMHLQAIELTSPGGDVQQVVAEREGELFALHDAVGADGPWATLKIDGREYVLIATPHCT